MLIFSCLTDVMAILDNTRNVLCVSRNSETRSCTGVVVEMLKLLHTLSLGL